MNNSTNSGLSGARDLVVWDPLVRLIHWSLALTILLNGTIVEEDGNLHLWIGYVSLGLVGLRLVWGAVGTKQARFYTFPPNLIAALRHIISMLKGKDNDTIYLSHNPLGALMAYNIWATVIVIAVSGYMMGTIQFFGVEWVEEFHEIAFDWLLVSIVLHIGGVIFDTWKTGVPLVRAMVDGRKRIPKGRLIK